MTTCMVYLRRSSNRDDRQKLSLPQQRYWVLELLNEHQDFKVIGLDWKQYINNPEKAFIYESHTAKVDTIRPVFSILLDRIKQQSIDWLIVWDPSRIARNNEDRTTFLSLLRNDKKIKEWIITVNSTFSVHKSGDVDYLDRLINDAIRMNQFTSETVKRDQKYRKTYYNLFMHKFPFWYKSEWINARVRLDIEKAEYYKLAVNMRLEWCSWKQISDKFLSGNYHKTGDAIKKMLANPIYYWEFSYDGKMYPIKNGWFEPLISKKKYIQLLEYNKINEITYKKPNPLVSDKSKNLLDYLVFDLTWRTLQWYKNSKTKTTFYKQPSKHPAYNISISEAKLFMAIESQIDRFKPSKEFSAFIRMQLESGLKVSEWEKKLKITSLEKKIKYKQNEINWLIKQTANLDVSLIEDYMNVIKLAKEEQKAFEIELKWLLDKNTDTENTAEHFANLFDDLPWTYKKVSKKEKANIIRGLWIYFIVWPDKHISVMGWDFEKLFIS